MSQPKRRELSDTEVSLLTISAGELVQEMLDDARYTECRCLGYQVWDKERDRELQVHVLVTSDTREFMEPFQTVVTE